MSYKDHQWRTLIVLLDPVHKAKMKTISERMGLSPSKIMGKVLENFIVKYEEKHGIL